MSIPKKPKPTFAKNWRERKIVHRTPGGKLTRVKISSLPADEQQKYNPNRFKRGADTMMGPDDFAEIQQKEVKAGHIFDFYIKLKNEDDLDSLEDGDLLLATTDGKIVQELFRSQDSDNIIMKLKNVSMNAVKKIALSPEDGEGVDYENIDNIEYETIDDSDGSDDTERYEKIKFNDVKLYQIDIAEYLPYIEKVVDMPNDDSDDITEGFYNFYFK
jgi:hypothetical protein